jgi:hypothetical protein
VRAVRGRVDAWRHGSFAHHESNGMGGAVFAMLRKIQLFANLQGSIRNALVEPLSFSAGGQIGRVATADSQMEICTRAPFD